MILPIPVISGSGEEAVDFINLGGYENFFRDLEKGFPKPKMRIQWPTGSVKSAQVRLLEVVSVGSFVASYVPSVKDFARLDARFRLPKGTWDKLPQYRDYGFAVFQLKKGAGKIHPMAFSFPSRLASSAQIYFPTVHIHDGEVHEMEEFDHILYGQTWPKAGLSSRKGWEESPQFAVNFTEINKSKELLWGKGHIYRKRMNGKLKNEDVIGQAILVG